MTGKKKHSAIASLAFGSQRVNSKQTLHVTCRHLAKVDKYLWQIVRQSEYILHLLRLRVKSYIFFLSWSYVVRKRFSGKSYKTVCRLWVLFIFKTFRSVINQHALYTARIFSTVSCNSCRKCVEESIFYTPWIYS